MSAAMTMSEVRAGAGESPAGFLRRAAAAARVTPSLFPLPEVAAWLERVSVDLDVAGGDVERCGAQEALRFARAVLGGEGARHG